MDQGLQTKIKSGYLIDSTEWIRRVRVKRVVLVLGLSLAKQIVEAFNGTITVRDNKPKGAIFEVKLATKSDSKKKSTSKSTKNK